MGKIEYLNGKSDEFTFNASILYSSFSAFKHHFRDKHT